MSTFAERYPMRSKDVAEYLGIPLVTVYKMRARGDIPYVRVGKTYRYSAEEVSNYIKKQSGRDSEDLEG